jgi:hypothetical protein
LIVELSSQSYFAKPGETITVTGIANRQSGVGIEGEVEISVPLLSSLEGELSEQEEEENMGVFGGRISEGQFSISFKILKNTPAGDYRIDAVAYEEKDGRKTSEGIAMANLKVFQVLTDADVAFNEQDIDPGQDFNFKPILLDQTGMPIKDELSIKITDEKEGSVFEKIMQSDYTQTFKIPTNLTAGYYQIEVSSGNTSKIKTLYVNEKAIVNFELKNNTLVITNIGNIPYNKDVEIELNGNPFIKRLNLDLLETEEFKLTGSNEEYNVKISDGTTELSQSGILLTGRAVGVNQVRGDGLNLTPIIWVIIIIVIIGVLFFLFRKTLRKKSFAKPLKERLSFRRRSEKKSDITLDKKGKVAEKPKETAVDKFIRERTKKVIPTQAEQVLVLKGHKAKVGMIVLKIKNKIGKVGKETLEKAIKQVYEKRGAVFEQGDYIFIIFSSLITKSFKNEVEAAKSAEKIKLILKGHNKHMKDRIEFGIAINSGDIINKVENGKLKFTALGNLIVSGKRLAEASDEQVLVTQEAFEAGIEGLHCEKRKVKGAEIYEVKRIMDSEKNKEFIKEFLERQKRESGA